MTMHGHDLGRLSLSLPLLSLYVNQSANLLLLLSQVNGIPVPVAWTRTGGAAIPLAAPEVCCHIRTSPSVILVS